jgi:hypothetical protein
MIIMNSEKADNNKILADFIEHIEYQNKRNADEKTGLLCWLDNKRLLGMFASVKQTLLATNALESLAIPVGTSEMYDSLDVENLPVSKLIL